MNTSATPVGFPVEPHPPIRAVWLGIELRAMREEAKLTVRDLAARIKKSGATVSRLELAQYPVSEQDVVAYMDMCGVTDPHRRADLLTIANDVAQRGWWNGYSGEVAPNLMDIAWMESKSRRIRTVDMTFLPGLLEVPGYAEALMRAKNPGASDVDLARWVDLRMRRQHILTQHDPVKLSSIIDEHLLHVQVGDRDVWKRQLEHLVESARKPNVDLRVLPQSRYTGLEGPFQVFELVDPYPTVAYVASAAGDICIEGQKVDRLRATYDQLWSQCLTPTASTKLIKAESKKL